MKYDPEIDKHLYAIATLVEALRYYAQQDIWDFEPGDQSPAFTAIYALARAEEILMGKL